MNRIYAFFNWIKKAFAVRPADRSIAVSEELVAKLRAALDSMPPGSIEVLDDKPVLLPEIKRTQLKPGDIIVLRFDSVLSCQGRASVYEYMNTTFPEHKCAIFDGVMSFDVLSPTNAELVASLLKETTATELIMRLNAAENRERLKAQSVLSGL